MLHPSRADTSYWPVDPSFNAGAPDWFYPQAMAAAPAHPKISASHHGDPHRTHRRAHRAVNHDHSSMVMNGMVLLLALCGWIIGGEEGARWAVSGGGALPPQMNPVITPEAMMRQFGARLMRRHEAPALFDSLAILCRRANLPRMPDLYCLPDPTMNAYALGGPHHSAITLTQGLLHGMTLNEVTGILAHELAHIRNEDNSAMNLAAALHRATSLVALIGTARRPLSGCPLAALLRSAPTIGRLLHLALSRIREFDADMAALELTGDPYALMAALNKLEAHHSPGPGVVQPEAADFIRFLRSHPETWERLRSLESLAF